MSKNLIEHVVLHAQVVDAMNCDASVV
jgi:hypothetical protein